MAKSERNAPCPCGSGRKHKRCCLERAAGAHRRSRTTDRVWERLQKWTIAHHPEHLDAAIDALFGDGWTTEPEQVDLLCAYAHLDRELASGGTPAERFAQLPGLTEQEVAAATSLATARLGLWRARAVEAGASIELEEVLGDRVVTVQSEQVSGATARWDVLLCRVASLTGEHRLWGPAAIFEAVEEEELVAEVRRLAAERDVTPQAAFRTAAAELLRFSPPSRRTPPSFFTFEGDEVVFAHARWELTGDDAAAALERHPDVVDTGDTEDGEGLCLEWTAPRRELAARRPVLPPRAVVLEATPVFVDPDERHVHADGSRIGLGTFELRPGELSFHAISSERLERAITLVAATVGDAARLVERDVTPLEERATSEPDRSGEDERAIAPELERAVVAGFARDRWRRMLDEPDSRFDGLTPREAASCPQHRPRVARWLRTLENGAAHAPSPEGTAPDVAVIRAELALWDGVSGQAA